MEGSMDGVVVICAEARAHITVIGTSRNIQLAREALGWAKLRGMHAPRILNLQNCDANKARGLREELDVVLQGTPRSLAVAIRARYERLGKSCRVALGSKSRIDPQGSILSGTMPSMKTDVKKNLDVWIALILRASKHCCLFHHMFHLPLQEQQEACDFGPAPL
jgi:hypothetical protein